MRNDTIYEAIHISVYTGYELGTGASEDVINAYYAEATEKLKKLGWEVLKSGSRGYCPKAKRGYENLYIHPMEITGDVLPGSVSELESMVSDMKTAKYGRTLHCGEVKEWDEDGYKEFLEESEPDIRRSVLETAKTKRRNLFRSKWDVLEHVAKKFSVNRVSHSHFGHSSLDPEFKFVDGVIDSLISSGELATGTSKYGGVLVRTV